ncbi:MAG: hypothetical protein E6J91_11575 [Deltaproteobacteria bacterium]|nr:MAG: hypothetical protein E6J91_11575 [Deltaproteobacteria bacterium]
MCFSPTAIQPPQRTTPTLMFVNRQALGSYVCALSGFVAGPLIHHHRGASRAPRSSDTSLAVRPARARQPRRMARTGHHVLRALVVRAGRRAAPGRDEVASGPCARQPGTRGAGARQASADDTMVPWPTMVATAVLLVGAGPAGLAAADALARAGLEFDWIDRHGAVGGAYRRMYPALELASPARHSALPGLPIDATGEYVRAGDYARYLERFAARIGRTPRRADLAELARDGGSLRARTDVAELGRYRAAVIATGMFDTPRPLDVPGLADAPGLRVLHARDWRGPAELAGARLLVVGGGMSGVEIAEETARAGFATTHAARRPVRTIQPRILGRELHDWAVLLERLPVPRWTKLCRGDARLPAIDRGFQGLVRAGRIALRPALVAVTGQCARFADGSEQDFDVIVCATGYRYATPFLPAEIARHENGMPILRRGRSASCADAARTARRLSRTDA